MVEISFKFEGKTINILSNENEKMGNNIKKFFSKTKIDENSVYFVYNGNELDEKLSFSQQANTIDLERKKMNILVNEIEKSVIKENEIISNEVICPECRESILMNVKDYKINLHDCQNNHKTDNISFNEFENTQKINLSEIICNNCNKNETEFSNQKFFFCCSCGKNLCLLCNSNHDKSHSIINYDDKNYICQKHNENFIKYCEDCNANICLVCENKHSNHKTIYLGDILPNKDNILKEMKDLRKVIDAFKNKIEKIKKVFDNITDNIEIYYKINENMINNYEIKKRNYQVLKNLNEMQNNHKNIIADLNKVINEKNINNNINFLLDIYNKIINNYTNKTEIYQNGDKYIGEFKNHIKDGKGTMYYNKNDIYHRDRYEGEWKNNLMEGKGTLYWNSKSRYEGDWKNGKREGKGILYYNKNDRYEGEYKDDKMEGKGTYYWSNGNRYEGEWKNDKKEGKGVFYYNDGDKYEGYWKNDKREGKGIYYWSNGNRYEGDWKNDKKEGKGIVYYQNGDREIGDFLNDSNKGLSVKISSDGKIFTSNI